MALLKVYQYLVLSVCIILAAAVPTKNLLQRDAQTVEFNASCWDMQTFDGPRASKAEILKLADVISRNKECALSRPNDESIYYMNTLGASGEAGARLLWTQADIAKGVFGAKFPCSTIAGRMRAIANACSAILNTEYLSFWTVMNACDAYDVNTNLPYLPQVGESGIALDVGAGGRPIPDLRSKRRWLAFAKIKLLAQEDESPVPGWDINSL